MSDSLSASRSGFRSRGARLLRSALLAVAALASAGALAQHHGGPPAGNRSPLDGSTLARFVDPLPRPRTAAPRRGSRAVYDVPMTQFTQKLHRDLPPTPLWGYGGTYPGPTFDVPLNRAVTVNWINQLPTEHLFPIDHTLHGAEGTPDVRAVVHLHGAASRPEFDGYPDSWFVPGQAAAYHYENRDANSPTLWYHDHTLGITSLNVYAGLAGFYFVRDPREKRLRLPAGRYEVPLLIQDRSFHTDGSLLPGFWNDTAVVNGKVWPFLEVEPRKYRLRLLNGSNARVLRLRFSLPISFQQVGTEVGLMERPVTLQEIQLAPAERADVVVDFASLAGQSVVLQNTALPSDAIEGGAPLPELPEIMQFRVAPRSHGVDRARVPPMLGRLRPTTEELLRASVVTRNITLDRPSQASFRMLIANLPFSAPAQERPRLGTVETWNLINLSNELHPIHIHLVDFRVVERFSFRPGGVQQFIVDRAAGTLRALETYLGPSQPIRTYENGPKDTVQVPFGEVARVVMKFEGHPGTYVYHCHILPHEDDEMMRPLQVIP